MQHASRPFKVSSMVEQVKAYLDAIHVQQAAPSVPGRVPAPEKHAERRAAALKALDFLVGRWHTTGEVRGTAGNPAIQITGTDVYEWVLDGAFLLHRVEVLMGARKVDVIELIGGDEFSGTTFPMRAFDNEGNFTTMMVHADAAGALTITGNNMRSSLVVSADGRRMVASWEQKDNGAAWIPWMEMSFTK